VLALTIWLEVFLQYPCGAFLVVLSEAYPIVKTKKSENQDRLLYVRIEIHCCWCPIIQRLMLPPLIVTDKERG
jgi:hypothetical protein